ncbi:MAG: SpoIIE family protein phosphatase [Phycisphaera sp. RhM]|nr:SpoIIE family protein phosphatase [Phycisphaera sp. RhM]
MMASNTVLVAETRDSHAIRFGTHFWGLVGIWTVAAACSLAWSLHEQRQNIFEIGRKNAETAYEKDLVYRRWLADHGGVYVWVTGETRPNVYLAGSPRREVSTPRGTLTLINPATATRQVYEMEAEAYGVRSHLTSLRPINPLNAPDPWEAEALRLLDAGDTEVCSLEQLPGGSYLRLMRPLVTEQKCLECHAEQGYRVGDIRGGISVSVPMQPLWDAGTKETIAVCTGHGLLWGIGLTGIATGMRRHRRAVESRLNAEEELREKEVRLTTFAERHARLKAEQENLENQAQLRLAGAIQQRLLPSVVPVIPGFELAGSSYPAEVTSGDFYDFVEMPDGCLGIVVADVSGHGTGPALLATETCAYLRALAETYSDVGEILTRLNKLLAPDFDDGYFVTLVLGRLDPADRSFVYAGAGHQSHLLHADGQIKTLDSTGLPLGLVDDAVIETSTPIRLQPSQLILLLTDGIAEAADGEDELYGMKRALDLVRSNRRRPAVEIIEALCRDAMAFSAPDPQNDDMTAVVLKANSPDQPQ